MTQGGPIAPKGQICPLHKKDVSKVCHLCPWYTLLRGKDPQTGGDRDEWGCAVAWLPILSIEIAQKEVQTGAAVESFRNQMVKSNKLLLEVELEKAIERDTLRLGKK